MPTTTLSQAELEENKLLLDLLVKTGLTKSRGEGRRLIQGGGVSVNGNKVEDEFLELGPADVQDGAILLRKGKKVYHKVVIRD